MSTAHPSEALLARFEHDSVLCELVPSSAVGAMATPSIGASLLFAAALTAAMTGLGFAIEGGEAATVLGLVGLSMSAILPLLSYMKGRRIEVTLTPRRLEILWRSHRLVSARRSFELVDVRSVYVVPSTQQTPHMIRIVTQADEVWLPAGGVPEESLEWLADEIAVAVAAARERDADGPPPELEELLSQSTRALRERALRQQQARRERASS